MQKVFSVIILLLITLTLSSCTFKKNSNSLKSWQGKYFYQEKPIKAIAGYYMAMEWELDILQEADKYLGNLEVNGQQTYIKLQTEVVGDEKTISLLYSRNIDGTSENLQLGDTLFKISREGKELVTRWATLNPRLSENPPKKCSCFEQ
jgi:hypothetical protein